SVLCRPRARLRHPQEQVELATPLAHCEEDSRLEVDEFQRRAVLGDAPPVHDDHQREIADGLQPVGDAEERGSPELRADRRLDARVRVRVHARRRLFYRCAAGQHPVLVTPQGGFWSCAQEAHVRAQTLNRPRP
ncbi:MAG: hypothetical protein BJ554DRAFT_975, partial [Olpidium bornovanus]